MYDVSAQGVDERMINVGGGGGGGGRTGRHKGLM